MINDDVRFAESDHLKAKAHNERRKARLAGVEAVTEARSGGAVTDKALDHLVRELTILWRMQGRGLRLVKVTGTSRWDNYSLVVGTTDVVASDLEGFENIGNRRVTFKALDAAVSSARFTADSVFR